MESFDFLQVSADEANLDTMRSKGYKDSVTALSQRPHLIILTILVCLIVFPDASAQFAQQGNKLFGTGFTCNPIKGQSVSLSSDGNTAIVGGIGDNTLAGAAWVFTRSGGVWTQQGSKLVGAGAVGAASQGYSVALSADGNTAIVGGSGDASSKGAAWVFTRSGGVWSPQGGKLVGTGSVGNSVQGRSVAISSDGNTAIVGGSNDNALVGAAWVFTRSGGVWTQQGSKLVGAGAVGAASQGYSVALSADGNTAIVGGRADNADTGAVWIWTRTGIVWTQQGSKLVGNGASGYYQGTSVSLSADGNTAIVGGVGDNNFAGAVWVFTRSGGIWTQQGAKLVGAGAIGASYQGQSVSLSADGNKALVGGEFDNVSVGAAWVWTRSAGVWTQQGTKLVGSGTVGGAQQGGYVSISGDGNTAIVGGDADNSAAGAAWVFIPGEPRIASIVDIPVDQGGRVRVTWNKSFCDAIASFNPIASYGLWRQVPPGGVATSSAPMSVAKALNSALAATYDFIATIPAARFDSYAYVASTLTDSTASGRHRYTFMVSAHTADPTVFFVSAPDSGYSVDNLPPSAPQNASLLSLSGARIRVQWDRNRVDPDVASYSIYRSVTSGFPVNQTTRLATTADTTKTDSTTLNGQQYYYRVTTVDIHGNESSPTAELSTLAVGVGQVAVLPAEFALEQNYPNPFNPSTEIKFSVATTHHATIEIYNSLGQRVAVLFDATAEAGQHYTVMFDGSKLASGTYLYRLQSGSFVETKKLMLVK